MKIVKNGTGAKRKPVTFICKECGCVFVAEPTEYETRKCYSYSGSYNSHQCRCPECGEPVTETEVVADD